MSRCWQMEEMSLGLPAPRCRLLRQSFYNIPVIKIFQKTSSKQSLQLHSWDSESKSLGRGWKSAFGQTPQRIFVIKFRKHSMIWCGWPVLKRRPCVWCCPYTVWFSSHARSLRFKPSRETRLTDPVPAGWPRPRGVQSLGFTLHLPRPRKMAVCPTVFPWK